MASVTWIGSSGDWSDPANWDGGTVPGAGDDVTLPGFGYYLVTASVAIDVASLTLQPYSTALDLFGSGVKDVVAGDLTNGGSLSIDGDYQSGGTSLDIGGTFTNQGSALIGEFYGQATGSTIVHAAHLNNQGSLSLYGGADESTRAVLDVTGDAAPASLDAGTYVLEGYAKLQFASGSITSIGYTVDITLNGAHARIANAANPGSNSALADLANNAGILNLEGGASLLNLQTAFQNQGALEISSGKFSTAAGVDLTNTGLLSVGEGSSIRIGGTLTNTDIVYIGDGFSPTPSFASVGHLINSGSLTVGGYTGTSPQQTTIFRDLGDAAPTVLSNGVSLSVYGNALLEFASGSITDVAQGATLKIDGAQARIADAGATNRNSALSGFASNAGTFTIADGAVLKNGSIAFENSGTYTILNHTSVSTTEGFTNSGTLNVDTDGSQVVGYSGSTLTIGGALTNTGFLHIQSGNSFEVPVQPTVVTVHGLAAIGSIDIDGYVDSSISVLAELNDVGGVAPTTLQSGDGIFLTGDALLQFASGGITSIASGAELSIDGTRARVADSNRPTLNSALTGLSSNAGTLVLSDGVNLRNSAVAFNNSGTFSILNGTAVVTQTGVNFTNSGTLNLDSSLLVTASGSTLAVGGTLTNSGTLNIGGYNNAGADITEVNTANFVNMGTVNLASKLGFSDLAWLNDAGSAPATLVSGVHLNLYGDALMEFGSGKITSISAGASISLNGPQAFIADAAHPSANSALSQLASNAGFFSLSNGSSIENSGSFSNSGTLTLFRQETFHVAQDFQNSGTFNIDTGFDENGGGGQSAVTVGGTLTNSGTIDMGAGIPPISGDTTIVTAHFINTGKIVLGTSAPYQATIDVLDDNAPSTLVSGVSIFLGNSALLEYAGGSITSIAKGAQLNIDGTDAFLADSSDISANSALSGLVGNAGSLFLSNGASIDNGTNDFSNAGSVVIGSSQTSPASMFTVGGALTNSGSLTIEGTQDSTISAASLTNSGGIIIGQNGNVNIAGDVTNTGTVNIGPPPYLLSGFLTASGKYFQQGGETVLNNGTLAAGRVVVSGGLLDGTGQVSGDINVTDGIFAAGFFKKGFYAGTIDAENKLIVQTGGTIGAMLLADTGATSLIKVGGTVQLNGGVLDLKVFDPSTLHAGETFTIMTFGDGKLSGEFSEIVDGIYTGDGTSVNVGKGLTLDVLYNNSAGNIQVQVVATPAPAAHDLMADNARHALLTNDAVLALDAHGLSWHHGDHALHFEHAIAYDNAPVI